MGSKPFRIWDDSAKDPKSAWWSKSLSSIEEVFNSKLQSNYRITKVLLTINADYDGGTSLSRVYMKAGFGSTNGISKELLGETRISKDTADYPSSGIDITNYFDSKSYPFKLSKANGSYLSVNIYTANNIVTDLRMNHADVVVDYVTPYTITLNANGGTCPVSSITRYSGETYGAVTSGANNPTKAGHTFYYWSTNADGTGRIYPTTTVTGNTTLYAQYTVNSYTISKEVSPSGSGDVTGAGIYEYGKSATLEAIPNAGYRFIKWNDNVTTNPRTITVAGKATYTAYFEQIPPPKFTSVEIKYLDKQVSPSNKVIVNESFIISVSIT